MSHSDKKASFFGQGYIGPVWAVVFANAGYACWGFDPKTELISKLAKGEPTIEETGLSGLLKRNKDRLHFTHNEEEAVLSNYFHFECIGTPANPDGSANISHLVYAVYQQASIIRDLGGEREIPDVFIIKSTVPVFTNKLLTEMIENEVGLTNFHVVSSPEFGAEGTMVGDIYNPHKIVIGIDDSRPGAEDVRKAMLELYSPFFSDDTKGKVIVTDPVTAELIKLTCNAALMKNISFANDGAALYDKVGGDWKQAKKAMMLDKRIGGVFHNPSPKAAGMCFPKDAENYADLGRRFKAPQYVIEGAILRNNEHALHCAEKVSDYFQGNLAGKRVGVLGISFKPETDDVRYSAAFDFADYFVNHTEAESVVFYDAIAAASENFRRDLQHESHSSFGTSDKIIVTDTIEDALDVDALIIATESREFKIINFRNLPDRLQFVNDTRNMLKRAQIEDLRKSGKSYTGNGRYSLVNGRSQ